MGSMRRLWLKMLKIYCSMRNSADVALWQVSVHGICPPPPPQGNAPGLHLAPCLASSKVLLCNGTLCNSGAVSTSEGYNADVDLQFDAGNG